MFFWDMLSLRNSIRNLIFDDVRWDPKIFTEESTATLQKQRFLETRCLQFCNLNPEKIGQKSDFCEALFACVKITRMKSDLMLRKWATESIYSPPLTAVNGVGVVNGVNGVNQLGHQVAVRTWLHRARAMRTVRLLTANSLKLKLKILGKLTCHFAAN